MTRWSGSSGGTSLCVRSAIDSRSALRSRCCSCSAIAGVALERRRLQERQHLDDPVVAEHVDRRGDRTIGVGGERGRDEQLRPVGPHVAVRRGDLRGAEVGERRRTVGPNDEALGVHAPVRDAELVEAPERTPGAAEELGADVVRCERREGAPVRIDHEERISLVRLARPRSRASRARRRARRPA